ncbi:protein enabled [Anopheles darlingi]|uniref:protein enabled n=1 Tax=Anopheles darlingi TaxID=43151 RepID=UPI0021005EF0|nr:protein enabled [Anopheles darlingi]XP_049533806.1 protein enabled [Anopheles darlingi]XP_049533807.1 protein enabled [Anopheles darlingi]
MINSSVRRRAGHHTGSVEQLVVLVLLAATLIPPYHTATATLLPSGTFTVAKRMYIETCLARFDVHLNTIIRTEASQSMGARYLDEADVNSREQCLRLCCETENCDVYVFEEKSPGTCFLFQCGPPENFRCKFTRHSNYTSAVLSIPAPMEPQPSAPLAAQIRALAPQPADTATKLLSQNEMELVSLKDRAAMMGANSKHRSNTGSTATTMTMATTTTTPLPPLGVRLGDMLTTSSTASTLPKQVVQQQPRQPPSSTCGIFEFSCHSGDCIAVYNVCDGIPQCEDGSDEGAECPQKNSGPILSPVAPAAVAGGRIADEMPSAGMVGYLNQPAMMQPNGASTSLQQGGGSQLYQPIDFRQPPPPNRFIISPEQQQQQQQQQQAQVLSKQMLMHRNREDPMTAPKAAWPRSGFNEFTYEQPINNGGHIFSHKGGLQLGSGMVGPGQQQQQQQQQQYQEPALPDASYRSASSMDLAGGGGTPNGNGGQLYLPVPGSPYASEQEPKQLSQQQQQQLQQQALSSQSQWRTMWSPQQPSAHVPPLQLQPQEQYIQPPIQQRPPDTMILRQNAMNGMLQQEPNGAAFNRGPPNQQSINGQWPVDSERAGVTTVVPTAFASSISAIKPQATDQELPGSKGAAAGGPERSDLRVENTGSLKAASTGAKPGNADVEYEDDDLEGVYPETTNSDGTGRDVESPSTTVTEAPVKKPHKHHKHDHQQATGASSSTNGSEGGQHGGTGGGKKKKKTKTIKKDKVPKDETSEAGDTGYSAVHEHLKAVHQGLQIEFADHDGYADRPGGAMLSLTLGVLLTAALGILLSCRMRVARRRVRRPGKSSYAHDADFLVNGMYL